MIFKVGPFTLYRVEKNGTLDVSLTALGDWPCGWEYGYQDPEAKKRPWIEIRLGKLVLFYFEAWKNCGFELWFMGFWLIK